MMVIAFTWLQDNVAKSLNTKLFLDSSLFPTEVESYTESLFVLIIPVKIFILYIFYRYVNRLRVLFKMNARIIIYVALITFKIAFIYSSIWALNKYFKYNLVSISFTSLIINISLQFLESSSYLRVSEHNLKWSSLLFIWCRSNLY